MTSYSWDAEGDVKNFDMTSCRTLIISEIDPAEYPTSLNMNNFSSVSIGMPLCIRANAAVDLPAPELPVKAIPLPLTEAQEACMEKMPFDVKSLSKGCSANRYFWYVGRIALPHIIDMALPLPKSIMLRPAPA